MIRPMTEDEGDRSETSSLKGWLSDVYFPALLEGQLGQLALRLGARATIDEPELGRAQGLAAVQAHLAMRADWLQKAGATYERGQFTTGVDRDVTEGTLTVKRDGATSELPVAVVAERRRSREVELRVYHPGKKGRERLLPVAPSISLGAPVGDFLAAAKAGDLAAMLVAFEQNGVLRDGAGRAYGKANGSLKAYFEKAAPLVLEPGGYAEDGRACALEYTVVRMGGRDVSARAGLAVFERGDSGLLRALRIYDDAQG
jgi:hypothetical protein